MVNPIPGPHQTSGTATQLEVNDNDKELMLLLLLLVTDVVVEEEFVIPPIAKAVAELRP